MIRNVIFDWSGTLVDDLPTVWHACNRVFRHAGVSELSLDQFREEIELPIAGFYRRYVSHVPEEDLQRWFFEGFLEQQHTIQPLPNAEAFIRFCRDNGLKTLVLTAVPSHLFGGQVARFGWLDFFDATYLGVADKRLQIGDLVRDHQLAPDETIYVGDMEHDVATAKHAGIRSIAVLTGYDTLPQLRRAEPDFIVEHLGELRRMLEQNQMQLSSRVKSGKSVHMGGNVQATHASVARPIATVGALIKNATGQMLLVRTNKWSNLWGIPGGKIDWGETCVDALKREILEETGLTIKNIQWAMVQDAISPPEFYRDAHFLLLNYTCDVDGPDHVQLNDEAQSYRWVNWDQAWELPLNGPTRTLLERVELGGSQH
jgi:phosphoglycolate phosphatase-like HAD superfamily hydrolase/ADP-ribose pyrophosphatase YjhB (NUDIX family)